MKKRQILILCSILLVLALLGGVLLYAVRLYVGTGLSLICEFAEQYSYNGKFLLSENGETALFYRPVGRANFQTLKQISFDLSPYGFPGVEFPVFSLESQNEYGVTYTNYYPIADGYEAFWPVSTGGNFVYITPQGEKIRILPKENLSFPMFADSIDGVDPYGTDILGFSANASWAISLSGMKATLYHTDPMDDSLRIVETKTVDFSQYGTTLSFGAFTGNKEAYLIAQNEGEDVFVALNCETGESARSLCSPEREYSEPIDRLYAQILSPLEEEKETEEGVVLSWSHLLLDEVHSSPRVKEFREGEIFAVSPGGGYAMAKMDGGEKILVLSEKRAFLLHSVLQEGETVIDADFISENVILVSVLSEGKTLSRVMKICF